MFLNLSVFALKQCRQDDSNLGLIQSSSSEHNFDSIRYSLCMCHVIVSFQLTLSHTEHQCYAGSGDGSIFLIDLTHSLEARVLAGGEGNNGVSFVAAHTGATTCIAISGDDSKIVSGGEDGRIFVFLFLFCLKQVWDCQSMQVLREYKGNNASSKMSPKEGTDEKRIIFIDVIPYPTLLFESRSTIESVM